MKYVWASYRNKASDPLSRDPTNTKFRAAHIRQYRGGVTFSCAGMSWSAASATYSLELPQMHFSVSRP